MKIGVICAMEEEIRELLAVLEDQEEAVVASQHYYHGHIHGQEVTLVESGIGKVQAGMVAAILLDHYQPDVLINTGSAGGIGTGLKVGDVVVSTGVAYHDVDSTAFGYKPGQLPQQPQIFTADADFVAKITAAAQATNLTTHTGLIVSGDQFISSTPAIKRIKGIFPQALASEMEGAAVGQVATQFHTPFVVIRAMSDVGDENASVSFDEFIIDAGKRSAAMLLAFLAAL
ncbi:5'-methylthioadenosine/adenosylhomocysteine nucleosidase [Lacticaseibacillus thailandensis]|uniref:5'-methylthioadenosine/S-adenosylhomocysteine nucleosidase n=1 Tax=Lacticaseibacillus thailandensis DSM 22698 = JCM 13996 TaxID=1423810 RepID=A0A0R2C9A7_9LACO|nr:5'-methylthioadenosine/adenosylhomocysteine nucleosidase [Lacticaseibacillus thailandensis]KRM87941.1 nucleoside phosphorylase [Lacticaseibacillus thailandensis DSM 22698 = JCM 13996]